MSLAVAAAASVPMAVPVVVAIAAAFAVLVVMMVAAAAAVLALVKALSVRVLGERRVQAGLLGVLGAGIDELQRLGAHGGASPMRASMS